MVPKGKQEVTSDMSGVYVVVAVASLYAQFCGVMHFTGAPLAEGALNAFFIGWLLVSGAVCVYDIIVTYALAKSPRMPDRLLTSGELMRALFFVPALFATAVSTPAWVRRTRIDK